MIRQGTEEWRLQRCGLVTASRVADVVAKTKSGWGASRANYAAQLLAERLTGTPFDGFTSAAMQHGIETEPLARAAYAFMTDNEVVEAPFIPHPTIAMSGCSCDGLVGDTGLVEIKAPQTSTHIDTLLGSPIPDKYLKQIMWQMGCTGRRWCDFVSFDPRMPAELQLKVIRVHRDEALVASLEADVRVFLAELDAKEAALRALVAA